MSVGVRTSITICKNCGKAINRFRDTEKDKWIPLESNYDREYEKPEDVDMDEVAQWRHKCNKTGVLKCNKGCGAEIYFDPNNKYPSGKFRWKWRRMRIILVPPDLHTPK